MKKIHKYYCQTNEMLRYIYKISWITMFLLLIIMYK